MARHDGSTVAITGAAGYIGRRLTARLAEDDRISRILAFDVRRVPPPRSSKIVFDQLDVRSPQLIRRLDGCDAVIHLAFVMDPIRDEAEMRDVNVNGSQNVLSSALRAGVPKLIYTSSATVYGAHPDNAVPLTESCPLRANLDLSYAAHKLEVEYLLRELREEFPAAIVTTFRPALVFGPHVDNAWSHLLEFPVLFGVKGHRPPWQFVHEDDVAEALRAAVFQDLDGAYNLAPDGYLDHRRALAIVGRRWIEVEEATAVRLLDSLWRLGLSEAPPGILHYVMHPWVVSAAKLAEEGFAARRSNAETLAETADRSAGHVRLGRRRYRRAHVRKGLAGAGVGVTAAAAWALRRSGSPG